MEALKKLNEIEVIEYDGANGEIIYIDIEDTKENREILKTLGATDEDFEIMAYEEENTGLLDIATFAFDKVQAVAWHSQKGFTY